MRKSRAKIIPPPDCSCCSLNCPVCKARNLYERQLRIKAFKLAKEKRKQSQADNQVYICPKCYSYNGAKEQCRNGCGSCTIYELNNLQGVNKC